MPIFVYEVTRKNVVSIEAADEATARREATDDPNGEQMSSLMKGEPVSVELIDTDVGAVLEYGSIGSISSGTMRNEDLIDSFARELRLLVARNKEVLGAENLAGYEALLKEADEIAEFDSDQADDVCTELAEALSEFAPPYFYFGAHPGDGADFGFWLPEGFDQDFEGLKVNDTSEVPKGYNGEVLHVNDHGNCTLYSAVSADEEAEPVLTEIWAVV